jgi:hypothetical protein
VQGYWETGCKVNTLAPFRLIRCVTVDSSQIESPSLLTKVDVGLDRSSSARLLNCPLLGKIIYEISQEKTGQKNRSSEKTKTQGVAACLVVLFFRVSWPEIM